MILRIRDTAIVETSKGILLVSKHGKRFSFPGGGIKRKEPSICAAVRELYEETNLRTLEIKYLFDFVSEFHFHKVYWIKPLGILKTKNEINHIAFLSKENESKITLAPSVAPILKKYKAMKK